MNKSPISIFPGLTTLIVQVVLFPHKDNQYCGLESKCRVAKGMSGMRGKRVESDTSYLGQPPGAVGACAAGWAGPQGNNSLRKVVINASLAREIARKTLKITC